MVNLAMLIDFWKKKEPSAPTLQSLVPLPAPSLEAPRTTSLEAANRAREALKLLKLERQILGSAITTIYESQTKGLISQAERDQLMEKYKVELKRLEKSIDENQRIVDLFDLESEREELVKNFKTKLAELDGEIKGLRSGGGPPPKAPAQPKEQKQEQTEEKKSKTADEPDRKERQQQSTKEKKPESAEDQEITEAEKRVEQIREEILKAMDRLEQIEAEG